ncbi:MAG: hypothetical protein OEZ24_03700 [Candidatus Bathyarchaeota archaeon]|nr:hypothetical protein [Candidatus Bathyarchaeota archaeon]
MSAHSAFQEKMDVLDIIISILRDHEEALSKLADRFEGTYSDISAFRERIAALDGPQESSKGTKVARLVEAAGRKGPLVTIGCKDWLTFRSLSHGALLVAFEASDDDLVFSSVTDLFVFSYSEQSAEVARLMGGMLGKWAESRPEAWSGERASSRGFLSQDEFLDYEPVLSPTSVRKWLSIELAVPEETVVEARVLC